MRERVERIGHADVVARLLADLWRDHEALDAREVALIRERDQVEHQAEVLVEVLRGRARHLRQRQLRDIAVLGSSATRRSISRTLSR